MGWFDKKQSVEKKQPNLSLPELPKLPELPNIEDKEPIHQLPSFPNNSLGDKFSQDTIKDAVTGKKEGEGEGANEFVTDNIQKMPAPPIKPIINEFKSDNEKTEYRIKSTTQEAEPIFVRIDKFEESLEIFEKTKEKISEIDETLKEIKEIKKEEEDQLNSWEKEIQKVKGQIEKIDKELFSKL